MVGRKVDPVWVLKVCALVLFCAFVFNFAITVFSPRAQAAVGATSGEPSFANPGGIIPQSEDIPKIDFVSFIQKFVRTTGIYAFITNLGEIALTPSGEEMEIYSWMKLIMVLVGFGIVYLGAAKNFEPLLLVPIGFGVIFANIPFA